MIREPAHRPVIFDYRAVPLFLNDMFHWRKAQEPGFSVRRETARLYRCSPALVTRVLQGKRRLTVDRVPAFAKLLQLTPEEERYLRQWLTPPEDAARAAKRPAPPRRRTSQNHILSDWLHLYVKDAARLKGFKPDPAVIFRLIGGIATPARIRRSLDFLFRYGFLRKTLDGKIVENEVLVTTTDERLNKKLQTLHRQALAIARDNIPNYPLARRRESLVVLTLNEASLKEMKTLLKEFYERLLQFAEEHPNDTEGLYQILINLSPLGAHHGMETA